MNAKKLHNWFVGTNLYKKNLESYVQGRKMTWATKLRIIFMVTILMSVGFTVMLVKKIYIPCIILLVVWMCHIVYFVFCVKTLKKDEHTILCD